MLRAKTAHDLGKSVLEPLLITPNCHFSFLVSCETRKLGVALAFVLAFHFEKVGRAVTLLPATLQPHQQSLMCVYPAQVGQPSSKETHRSQDLSVGVQGGIHQSCLLVGVHSHR